MPKGKPKNQVMEYVLEMKRLRAAREKGMDAELIPARVAIARL